MKRLKLNKSWATRTSFQRSAGNACCKSHAHINYQTKYAFKTCTTVCCTLPSSCVTLAYLQGMTWIVKLTNSPGLYGTVHCLEDFAQRVVILRLGRLNVCSINFPVFSSLIAACSEIHRFFLKTNYLAGNAVSLKLAHWLIFWVETLNLVYLSI